MALLDDYRFPPIKNEDKFEDFCLDLTKVKYSNAEKNGRRGQRQNGVDIYYSLVSEMNEISFYGIQCKAKGNEKKLKRSEIEKEINKAKLFYPKIKEYEIITTYKRDANLQEFIREQNIKLAEEKLFYVKLTFWEDIESKISGDEYFSFCEKHFPQFFINIRKKGYSVSKLFSVNIGVEDNYDSGYEIMIGKTIKTDNESCFGIYYFQNSYFICDLNNKKMDTFPDYCCESDLEQVFNLKRDRYIVSKWLRETNIEEILTSENMSMINFSISEDEYKNFLSSNRNIQRKYDR